MFKIVLLFALPLAAESPASLTPDQQAALSRVNANSLRGMVSFLASDALEGRATPSRGLDVAAEYIASQFRGIGLEPAGDDGYFQTSRWLEVEQSRKGIEAAITLEGEKLEIPSEQVTSTLYRVLELSGARVVKLDAQSTLPVDPTGKVVLTAMPELRAPDSDKRRAARASWNAFQAALRKQRPALVIAFERTDSPPFQRDGGTRLVDPEAEAAALPVVTVRSQALGKLFDRLPAGETAATASVKLPALPQKELKLRNVIGVLRGADPKLKDTYVLVSAHYDHVGVRGPCESDCIYNGANDDASGTAGVMELAAALKSLKTPPPRSIVFALWFGEEEGLLGSGYYGRKPVFPLAHTVANINLEHIGRSDSTEGPKKLSATLTGFNFSDVSATFVKAGKLTGVEVYNDPKRGDPFFARSDNQALANRGVPSHTLCVAFEFSEYHAPGDHWDKLDYDNMTQVTRMVGAGLLLIAQDPVAPKWNESNTKTSRYVQAAHTAEPRHTEPRP